MNAPNLDLKPIALSLSDVGKETRLVRRIFKWINIAVCIVALMFCVYWLFATDRYVSNASIIIQNTDQASGGMDLPLMIGGGGAFSYRDQMLLQSHLLSVDMLQKLDKVLDLRSHYSDSSRDLASRMWFQDASIEWFHRHYLGRVSIYFDPTEGVLHISSQAYTAKMAQDITRMLVSEGEKYMNELSHELARTQVAFLEGQVEKAQNQMREANEELIAFQNRKGLLSAKATVENIHTLIGKLEQQRTGLQTQMDALPRAIDRNHPTRVSLSRSIQAVEKQIGDEQAKLASAEGSALNTLVEEEQRLELEAKFKQDVYKSALLALETGRMDAARTLKRVSIIQSPTMPEYPWQPRRIYGLVSTLCLTLFLLGILRLLRSVILDHVD